MKTFIAATSFALSLSFGLAAYAAPPSGLPRGAQRTAVVSSLTSLGKSSPAFDAYEKAGDKPKVNVTFHHSVYDAKAGVAVVGIVAGNHQGAWANGDRGGRKTVSQAQYALHKSADGKFTPIQISPMSATYAGSAMDPARATRNRARDNAATK